jgi:type IV secretion system protein TrbE
MMNLVEYRNKPDRLSDWVYWAGLVAPGVVLNKDGALQCSLAFRGPDLDSSTEPELVSITARVNNILKRRGSGWATFIEARRRESRHYPGSAFPDPASFLFDLERTEMFQAEGTHYESDFFITFVFMPPSDTVSKASSFLYVRENVEVGRDHYHDHLNLFVNNILEAYSLLNELFSECRVLDDSETLTYLHSCVSTTRHHVQAPPIPMYLDALLCDTPLYGGITPKLGDHFIRCVSVLGFPGATTPGYLDDFNRLPFAYRWMTRFIHLDKEEATKEIEKLRRYWFSGHKSAAVLLREILSGREAPLVNTDALAQADDATEALAELGDDLVAYGFMTTVVVLTGTDERELDAQVEEVKRIINSRGFVVINETVNAVEAWLGTIPGNAYANVRQYLISSLSLAHLIPLSAVWPGPETNAHLEGPPLAHARTGGANSFRLDLHRGDVGHTTIVGPTGTGKSALISFLMLQFRRYKNSQTILFDKGKSGRGAIRAMGGRFYELSTGGGLAFQPLREIDQPEEIAWAEGWVTSILTREGVAITAERRAEIWGALKSLASAPVDDRTFTSLATLIQDRDIHLALQRYTIRGPYGALLDASTGELAMTSAIGFEMEELMTLPDLTRTVLSYLFHMLEKRFDGRPTLLILDEGWLFLDYPEFATMLKEWLKTLRKQNVSVIFATQSLADVAKSSIAPAIIESCPTRIYLPNDKAMEPTITALYQGFGLNEQQIRMLSQATPKRHYYMVSSAGNRLFELGLGNLGLALATASSPVDHVLFDELDAAHGDDNEGWLSDYLTKKGLASWLEHLR